MMYCKEIRKKKNELYYPLTRRKSALAREKKILNRLLVCVNVCMLGVCSRVCVFKCDSVFMDVCMSGDM